MNRGLCILLVLIAITAFAGCGSDQSLETGTQKIGLGGRERFRIAAGSTIERPDGSVGPIHGYFVTTSPANVRPNFLFDLRIERLRLEGGDLTLTAVDGRAFSYTSFPRLTFVLPDAQLNGRVTYVVGSASASAFLDDGPKRGIPSAFRGILIELSDGIRLTIYAKRLGG